MTLAYLSTPLVGLVDTAVIGQLGVPALIGGVAVGAIIFDVVFTTFNFLRSGTTGLSAQALGGGHHVEQNAIVLRALILAAISGVLVLALQWPILEAGLALIEASEAVEAATREYFSIRVLAAPFALANYAILGWLLGQARAGLGLLLQVLLNGTNIALSIFLVLELNWGVPGIAWATVVGEAVAAFAGGILVVRMIGRTGWPAREIVLSRAKFIRMIAINRDIMIRSFTLLAAFAFFTAQGARSGEILLAANAVLMNFFMVAGYFLDGFATAAEQLAGRAVGARWRPAFDRAVRLTLIWGIAIAGFLSLVFWFAGPLMIDIMTTAPEVRLTARDYLIWSALTPIAGVVAFQMDGIFIGSTWSRDMRNMMLVSLAIYLAAWWFLTPIYGNHGLWISLLIFLGLRGISLSWRCGIRARQTFSAA